MLLHYAHVSDQESFDENKSKACQTNVLFIENELHLQFVKGNSIQYLVLLKTKKICRLYFYCKSVHIQELPKPLGQLFCNVFNQPHFQYVLIACCLYSNENMKSNVETWLKIKTGCLFIKNLKGELYHMDTNMLMTRSHLIRK